jgi:hypothetical protein
VPIIDLVSPWAHAAASLDAREMRSFRARHAVLLERIRQQRTPLLSDLPAPNDWRMAAARAGDGDFLDGLRAIRDRMVEAGFRTPGQIVLAACGAPGPIAEVMPADTVVLFLDRNPAAGRGLAGPGRAPAPAIGITSALASAVAILHRWTDPRRNNPIARLATLRPWDKWQVAREVPLAEWIYAAGIGVHAAIAYGGAVGATHASPLQMTPADIRRLRAMEHELQSHLDADLDHTGAGLLLRWLDDDAPPAMRRCADGSVVPRGAGRYLGWRMLGERVARVGVEEAAVMGT